MNLQLNHSASELKSFISNGTGSAIAAAVDKPVFAEAVSDPIFATGIDLPVFAKAVDDPLFAKALDHHVFSAAIEVPVFAKGIDTPYFADSTADVRAPAFASSEAFRAFTSSEVRVIAA